MNDQPRSGRPYIYDEEQRGQMVVTAKTHPQQLGVELGHWTLDTLVVYVNEQLSIGLAPIQWTVFLSTVQSLKR